MGSLEGLSSALTISISVLATAAAIAGLFGETWDKPNRRLTKRGQLTLGLTALIFVLGVSQHFVSIELGERKSRAQAAAHRETVTKLERNAQGFEALLRSNVAAQEFKELTLKLVLHPSVETLVSSPDWKMWVLFIRGQHQTMLMMSEVEASLYDPSYLTRVLNRSFARRFEYAAVPATHRLNFDWTITEKQSDAKMALGRMSNSGLLHISQPDSSSITIKLPIEKLDFVGKRFFDASLLRNIAAPDKVMVFVDGRWGLNIHHISISCSGNWKTFIQADQLKFSKGSLVTNTKEPVSISTASGE